MVLLPYSFQGKSNALQKCAFFSVIDSVPSPNRFPPFTFTKKNKKCCYGYKVKKIFFEILSLMKISQVYDMWFRTVAPTKYGNLEHDDKMNLL